MGEQVIDLETQLHRYADQVESSVGPVGVAGPSRRRRLPLLAGATAIALAGALGGYLIARNDDADLRIEPADRSDQTTTTLGNEDETVAPTPEANLGGVPLAAREGALLVRTADGVMVWGGDAPGDQYGNRDGFADGAILDLATGQWRAMSPSPLPWTALQPLAAPIGDDRLLITRRVETAPFSEWPSTAAIYDVGADEWMSLPGAPFALTDLVAAPEIDAVFGIGANEVVRFDVETATWESTGPFSAWELVAQDVVPVDPNSQPSVVWTGVELVAVAGAIDGTFPIQTWTPGGEWEARGTITTGRSQVALDAAWVDGEVWVVGYDMTVDAWDPATGESRSLPDLPIRFQEGTPTIHTLDDGRVVVARVPGLAVWTGTGWEVEPSPSGPRRTIGPGVDGQTAAWSLSLPDEDGSQTLRVEALPRPGELRDVLIGELVLTLEPEESIGYLRAGDDGAGGAAAITLRIEHEVPALGCTFTALVADQPYVGDQVFTSGAGLGYDCGIDGIDRFLDRFRSVWPEDETADDDGADETADVAVPVVVGAFYDTAEATLRNVGLIPVVEFVTVPFGDPRVGVVVEQSPEGSVLLEGGSEVRIRVGEAGPAPED